MVQVYTCNSHDRCAIAVYCRDEDPGVIVGEYTTGNFENLPLLHKVLDSIGTHEALGLLNGILVK